MADWFEFGDDSRIIHGRAHGGASAPDRICGVVGLLLVEVDEGVALGADAELLGCLKDVGAVAGVDALDEGVLAVVGGVEHCVDAGAVEGHGVKRCVDAEVAHFGGGGVTVAVAVDGEAVGHVDVENVGADVVHDGLSGVGHGFKEGVLVSVECAAVGGIFGLSGAVDP